MLRPSCAAVCPSGTYSVSCQACTPGSYCPGGKDAPIKACGANKFSGKSAGSEGECFCVQGGRAVWPIDICLNLIGMYYLSCTHECELGYKNLQDICWFVPACICSTAQCLCTLARPDMPSTPVHPWYRQLHLTFFLSCLRLWQALAAPPAPSVRQHVRPRWFSGPLHRMWTWASQPSRLTLSRLLPVPRRTRPCQLSSHHLLCVSSQHLQPSSNPYRPWSSKAPQRHAWQAAAACQGGWADNLPGMSRRKGQSGWQRLPQ